MWTLCGLRAAAQKSPAAQFSGSSEGVGKAGSRATHYKVRNRRTVLGAGPVQEKVRLRSTGAVLVATGSWFGGAGLRHEQSGQDLQTPQKPSSDCVKGSRSAAVMTVETVGKI